MKGDRRAVPTLPALMVVLAVSAAATGAEPPVAVAVPTDPELLEFLAEFSGTDDAFVDPFALDKVGKAVDREIAKIDAEQAKAAPAASPATEPKEADDEHR